MDKFPIDIQFKHSWRTYQQRVLDNLDNYLLDGHLHIIAPPGSGKTILGLQVAITVNRPTLILAPTIAIRNQWIQKFCDSFLQTDTPPEWISREIRKPDFLTVVTYQGLHAACNNINAEAEEDSEELSSEEHTRPAQNQNLENIVLLLKALQVGTIVVDEAHHLKNEWWQTLIKIKQRLNPVIIGLTATPPYDVSANEWQRYIDLNGPIKVEISVPELVTEGDLCPHQDYVYLSQPTDSEWDNITSFRRNIENAFHSLKTDATLIEAIESHRGWTNPTENLEWIYSNLSFYSACLIFLNACGKTIPQCFVEITGNKNSRIPAFDYNWAETLLDFYLYKEKEDFKLYKDHKLKLEADLRRCGALENRQIMFSKNKKIVSSLTSSLSKLNSIERIVKFEYGQLGPSLRLVILTDFIRNEFYANSSDQVFDLNKIGIIPIFEKLRRSKNENFKIGVLTGSVVIIPKDAYPTFLAKIRVLGIHNIECGCLPADDDYILIQRCEQIKNDIVNIITQLFEQGEICVLVGTKSLLGEGWDAPSINSLILASVVGSFVLSNQMRGRAIRTQNDNADKTGNIWHLCCLDRTSTSGGADFEMLEKRCKCFVGVSDSLTIENGIGRLHLFTVASSVIMEESNQKTMLVAADREGLKHKWQNALETGANLVDEIKIPFSDIRGYKAVTKLYLNKTIAHLSAALGFGFMEFLIGTVQSLPRALSKVRSLNQLYLLLAFFGLAGLLIFGRKAYKTFKLYIKYLDIAKDLQQIGEVLLNTMIKVGMVKSDIPDLSIHASLDKLGGVSCHLQGGSTYESSAFINMLQEIIAPIDNPKYVIVRKSLLARFIKQKDFHTVPEYLGRNKESASYFAQQWEKKVGPCELIYTRTVAGRKILVQSRLKSLSSEFVEKNERISKWK
ncbi:DEAD/DEAH box helicase family protein [Mucilaginibacter psychrotolerans]|uniref:DEAD/DEAH box helicase n=1 Tax=Mucilaginibacter psychrotolerans TaxID=1524096 RepID=A0A4Y8S9T7_9SPHI|nr:DEAD/DEAH box helicase family protein [Mucilaginibacter psychrotolerans]TFF35652.1 DEAD/DEAH box helicase [Mucilaginibacter psychrotolerans]